MPGIYIDLHPQPWIGLLARVDSLPRTGPNSFAYWILVYPFPPQSLWGPGAEPGERECFQHYNSKGTAQGNCGKAGSKQYGGVRGKYGGGAGDTEFRKCSRADVDCGTLHCQVLDIAMFSNVQSPGMFYTELY